MSIVVEKVDVSEPEGVYTQFVLVLYICAVIAKAKAYRFPLAQRVIH
jgi:hypothetical protein